MNIDNKASCNFIHIWSGGVVPYNNMYTLLQFAAGH